MLVFFLVGFVYLNIEVLHFTSNPQFCAKCHPRNEPGPLGEVFTWGKNIHSQNNLACLDCHGRPGYFYYMKAKLKGLKYTFNFAFHGQEHMLKILHKVFNDSCLCLRSCLYGILSFLSHRLL
ncbi:MAG: NapC/NirT family cytochrome c [Caldimicrobium sp.]